MYCQPCSMMNTGRLAKDSIFSSKGAVASHIIRHSSLFTFEIMSESIDCSYTSFSTTGHLLLRSSHAH